MPFENIKMNINFDIKVSNLITLLHSVSYEATMKSTASIIVVLVGCISQFVAAQDKVCSSFCSSLGMVQSNPGKSCNDIYKTNKASRGVSGDYYIQTATGAQQVYCDMELECGSQKGGWMRIADLDTSRGDDCPSGWVKVTTPSAEALEVCEGPSNNGGCYPVLYPTHGLNYSRVCGMAKGYQKGTPDAFEAFVLFRKRTTINQAYVDGLSIVIDDNTPKHVWSYGVGNSNDDASCPCSVIRNNNNDLAGPDPQEFVKDNYYCESGNPQRTLEIDTYFTADPLWDGEGCSGTNHCCNEPGMPWFSRKFPTAVRGDIAARICRDQPFIDEGILIEQLQLYVQ